MSTILSRNTARAAGIEVADHIEITPKPGTSVLQRLVSAIDRFRNRYSAIKALSRLDDRMLRDIGVHRGMIRDAADRFADPRAAGGNETLASRVANDHAEARETVA